MKRGLILLAAIILMFCIIINCLSRITINNYPLLRYDIALLDIILDFIGIFSVAFCLTQAKIKK